MESIAPCYLSTENKSSFLIPPLRGREYMTFIDAHGSKEMTKGSYQVMFAVLLKWIVAILSKAVVLLWNFWSSSWPIDWWCPKSPNPKIISHRFRWECSGFSGWGVLTMGDVTLSQDICKSLQLPVLLVPLAEMIPSRMDVTVLVPSPNPRGSYHSWVDWVVSASQGLPFLPYLI